MVSPSNASIRTQTQRFPAPQPTSQLAYLCALCIYLFAGAQPGSCPKRIGRVTSASGLLLQFIQTEASPRSQSFIGVPQIFINPTPILAFDWSLWIIISLNYCLNHRMFSFQLFILCFAKESSSVLSEREREGERVQWTVLYFLSEDLKHWWLISETHSCLH